MIELACQSPSPALPLLPVFRPIFGKLIATLATILHVLPSVLLAVSVCYENGCAEPGCSGNHCLPAYSDAMLWRRDDQPSHVRFSGILLFVCLRAPVMCIALRFAYRRLTLCLCRVDASARKRVFCFDLMLFLFMLFDVMTVVAQNSGDTKELHVDSSFLLLCAWTTIIGMLREVITKTHNDPDGLSVTVLGSLWYASMGLGAWVLFSWVSDLARGPQWFICEWIFILVQGFELVAVGIAFQGCVCRATQRVEGNALLL
eukprot:TRINITY_DN17279_c0_g1_i1.p1 TRINITY_DN17279_c0_g1~~TRINITY_DN17279_c0_g1_i1.p1  ORF type:complete len:292 (+),score=14.45 TRINITY_DN17279_c0_g1_i1:101-877(+)